MRRVADDDLLTMIGCRIDRRPEAPGIDAIQPLVRSARREREALIVDFATDARPLVEAFAAAERVCCQDIGWDVRSAGASVILRITGPPEVIDAMATFFATELYGKPSIKEVTR
jgi:hypothetical protein